MTLPETTPNVAAERRLLKASTVIFYPASQTIYTRKSGMFLDVIHRATHPELFALARALVADWHVLKCNGIRTVYVKERQP